MSTNVNGKSVFHLSSDARRRLVGLVQQLLWLLDTDAREGFKESNLSYCLGPWLHSALMVVWCHPLKAVKKKFSYLGGVDCPRVFVTRDWYESNERLLRQLAIENRKYYTVLREHDLVKDIFSK